MHSLNLPKPLLKCAKPFFSSFQGLKPLFSTRFERGAKSNKKEDPSRTAHVFHNILGVGFRVKEKDCCKHRTGATKQGSQYQYNRPPPSSSLMRCVYKLHPDVLAVTESEASPPKDLTLPLNRLPRFPSKTVYSNNHEGEGGRRVKSSQAQKRW